MLGSGGYSHGSSDRPTTGPSHARFLLLHHAVRLGCGMGSALVATAAASMTSWSQLQAGWPGSGPMSSHTVTEGEKAIVLKSPPSVKDMGGTGLPGRRAGCGFIDVDPGLEPSIWPHDSSSRNWGV